jgi:hypothetical protein
MLYCFSRHWLNVFPFSGREVKSTGRGVPGGAMLVSEGGESDAPRHRTRFSVPNLITGDLQTCHQRAVSVPDLIPAWRNRLFFEIKYLSSLTVPDLIPRVQLVVAKYSL